MGNEAMAENNPLFMVSDAWENFDMGEPEKKRHDRTIKMCNVLEGGRDDWTPITRM